MTRRALNLIAVPLGAVGVLVLRSFLIAHDVTPLQYYGALLSLIVAGTAIVYYMDKRFVKK